MKQVITLLMEWITTATINFDNLLPALSFVIIHDLFGHATHQEHFSYTQAFMV